MDMDMDMGEVVDMDMDMDMREVVDMDMDRLRLSVHTCKPPPRLSSMSERAAAPFRRWRSSIGLPSASSFAVENEPRMIPRSKLSTMKLPTTSAHAK